MEELKLKKNILGGTVYIVKTPEQLKLAFAQIELNSRQEKEKLNAKETN